MRIFEKAKWIWFKAADSDDEYGDFFEKFTYGGNGSIICRISCDGDYTLYINGKFASSNQYGDFEHYKIFDEFDIAPFLNSGENTLSLTVWHHGRGTSRYAYGQAGVIFELVNEGGVPILSSSEQTRSRKNPCFESGRCRFITVQLGFGFRYDATFDDGALFTGVGFNSSCVIEKSARLFPRPNKRLCLSDKIKCASITSGNDGKYYLIDLGEESVGLLTLDITSPKPQELRIDWGEDLQRGHVRREIGGRLFSVEYRALAGRNIFTNYMLRLGARYIEIYAEEEIFLNEAGLIPQYYPVKERTGRPESGDDIKIYELCLKTLKLCMMEHYVDCPWREQAFYAFDSRNQMLAGYYAFNDGNTEYARSNLKLILEDKGIGGLLSICYPSSGKRAIPSFSLHFFTAVLEYIIHSGDTAFAKEAYPKLCAIIKVFIDNSKNGLISKFSGEKFWNFYDWVPGLEGTLGKAEPATPDAAINLLFIKALKCFKEIAGFADMPFEYEEMLITLPSLVKKTFFNKERRLYSLYPDREIYASLVNALAVTEELSVGDEADMICESMLSGECTESSLSFKCFEYDALISVDAKRYGDTVLSDIRKNYMHMINSGATSAWETINGASDFGNAGSLCHGWSSIPIYYYHKFGLV